MRILFLTSRLPYPPNRGDRLRAYHFLRQLAARHTVTLASFVASRAELEHVPALQALGCEVNVVPLATWQSAATALLNCFRPEPLQALYYRSGKMRRLIDTLCQQHGFDAAYIHLFRMAPYLENRNDIYRIVDLTDVISEEIRRSLHYRSLPSRLVYRIEQRRIERYERQVANIFEESWLISEQDHRLLQQRCPAANLQVIPNGVDLDTFYPQAAGVVPGQLVFVGHLGVPHNVDAAIYLAREILPRVAKHVPDCSLQLVGAEPDRSVFALGADPRIQVPGYVPDLNTALNQAQVFVAPLRFAAGVQNKVLEAMAAGRPVVTTSLVNQGLGATPDQDLLTADDSEGLAKQILSLLQDPELTRRVGAAGRRFVEAHFSWDAVVQRAAEIEASMGESSPAR